MKKLIPLAYIRSLGALCILVCQSASARDYYFPPSALEGEQLSQQDINLSLFSNPKAQLPGRYASSVIINKYKIDETTLNYVSAADGSLEPQLTPKQLRQWHIRVEAFPALAALPENIPLQQPIGYYIPAASAVFDFNTLSLVMSIPQSAISQQSRGFIDASRWDDGVPVLFSDYTFSGTEQQDAQHNSTTRQYLNLRNGLNLGGWRLRHASTWSNSDSDQSWQTMNAWVQHDIDFLRAQFTAGESSTRGEVFDSMQYKGVNLISDDEMLPWSQRGFAPVIRGIASTNAEVSVRQNGYLIYQASVAPGAFEINDLYATTNSGDLEVTVKEADGSEHHFTQPYASVAVMQRPGHLKYEVTAGRYRADNGQEADEPLFFQGSVIYGLTNALTLYGGSTFSPDYLALNSGAGLSLGQLGSLSADVTWARARLDNGETHQGQSWRLLYSGNVDSTGTSFTLAGYRYSTQGYYNFTDANLHYDDDNTDWQYQYNKRNRIQVSISQSLPGFSLYLNGYQQDYWGSDNKERSLSAGISRVFSGISMHLAYTYSNNSDSGSDQMLSCSFSIPLSQWLPGSWASYNVNNNRHGNTSHNIGLNGTLLEDDRLSYSLQQSRTNHGGADNSSVYTGYRSQYASLNAGYYTASDDSRQLSYGISGAIVAHPRGVTLSQPLGNQFAIISANGATGIRFQNQRGIRTDWLGNAIIPSLTPYQENTLRVDTTSLPADVDTSETALEVIPSRNAAVSATIDAHIGYRALIALHQQNGQPVPFGAIASVESPAQSGIVDDAGMLYLPGLADTTRLTVRWGNNSDQQCVADVILAEQTSSASNPTGIRQVDALCQMEPTNEK